MVSIAAAAALWLIAVGGAAPEFTPASALGLAQQKSASADAASAWTTRCGSTTRAGAVECSMEQRVLTDDTRQLLALFAVRIPADTRTPVIMIQLPLGLYLPAGLEMQVDQEKVIEMPVQTCDNAGCYVGAPLNGELSDQLMRGKSLRLGFQNLARNKLDVTMSLNGFAAAYAAIK